MTQAGMTQAGQTRSPGTVTTLRRPPVRQSIVARSGLGLGRELTRAMSTRRHDGSRLA